MTKLHLCIQTVLSVAWQPAITVAEYSSNPQRTFMAIPDYQSLMLPLLRFAEDGIEHLLREAIDRRADDFDLSDAERMQLLPSGATQVFASRVSWARTYLKQAELLSSPRRGALCITPAGTALLTTDPGRVDNKLLNQYAPFRSFQTRSKTQEERKLSLPPSPSSDQTPEDAMAAAYQRIRKSLESDLLEQVRAASPAFFERLVVDLLVGMGYGGSRQDAGQALGKSGDGGIDGMIKEDRLGLDVIYIQAKRWAGAVGRPDVQKFAGALQGQRAGKGVFITTSTYTKEATEFVNVIASKIILIDGEMLVRLMVDHNIAVSQVGLYELKRVDADYFSGE